MTKLISLLFHPIVMSPVTFFLLIFSNNSLSSSERVTIFFIAVIFSSVNTLLYVIYLKKKQLIDSFEIDERARRIKPLIFGIASFLVGFFILTILNAPSIVKGLMFCYTTNTLVVLLITFWWKISLHTTGISGPLVALNFHFGKVLLPFYLLIILVGMSRVKLKKHTKSQVVAGAVLGTGLTALQLYYLFL